MDYKLMAQILKQIDDIDVEQNPCPGYEAQIPKTRNKFETQKPRHISRDKCEHGFQTTDLESTECMSSENPNTDFEKIFLHVC